MLAVSSHDLLYAFNEDGKAHGYAAVKMQGFSALGSLSNLLLQSSKKKIKKKNLTAFALITYTASRHL